MTKSYAHVSLPGLKELFNQIGGETMTYCVNCGKHEAEASKVISGGQYLYEDEGEWVCSDECLKAVDEKVMKP